MKGPDRDKTPKPGELVRQLIEAQDERYEAIARLLHDDFGQQLAAIGILLSTLKRHLPPGDSESLEQFERTRQKIVALGESMRELSNKLHSSILEHTGIAVALRAYCAELSARPGIRILFESDGEFDTVPLRIGRGLYRIAQESLTGVARGSVRISFADRQLEMAIESETALSISPLGLAILRQRANSIGAALRMESSRLTVSVPLKTPRPGAQTTE